MNQSEQHDNLARPSKLLAIDSSTAVLAIALLEDGKVVSESHIAAERNHSIHLVPNIQELVKALGWRMKELEGIAVGQGPGSYTGVRIGVTVAKTMAWTQGIPLAGGSSLEALAYSGLLYGDKIADDSIVFDRSAAVVKEWIVPLVDARRGNVYTAMFETTEPLGLAMKFNAAAGNRTWERLNQDAIRPLDLWLEKIEAAYQALDESDRPGCIRFVGGLESVKDNLLKYYAAGRFEGLSVLAAEQTMRGEALGLIAYSRWTKEARKDVHELIPNYTQLAEAEAKWLEKQKDKQGVNQCERA
jgi:tRNA threonylcarbamoyladenosine biosynthesis protein TsaB